MTPSCGSRRFIRRPGRAAALSLALVAYAITVMWVATPSSSAYIYLAGPTPVEILPDDSSDTPPFRGPSTIERLTLDGSFVQPNFIDGPRVESGLDVDAHRVYWFDSSGNRCRLGSASLDGTDVRTLATLSSEFACGGATAMAPAGEYLYWSGPDNGPIGRVMTRPPYSVEPDFVRTPLPDDKGCCSSALMLVTDGSWLYWFDYEPHAVGRVRLDGTDLDPALFQPDPPDGNVGLIGVGQGYLWWGNSGSIGRARPDGGDPEPAFLTGIHGFAGAMAWPWLYYTGSACGEGCVDNDGTVSRVALEPARRRGPREAGPGHRGLDRGRFARRSILPRGDQEAPRRDRHAPWSPRPRPRASRFTAGGSCPRRRSTPVPRSLGSIFGRGEGPFARCGATESPTSASGSKSRPEARRGGTTRDWPSASADADEHVMGAGPDADASGPKTD